ncbi:MAG: putative rane protein [Bacteroidetes bacterium]|jgi:membrane associated rhomboid family serine protease|nr:putative rane protein [Bacteroidota bacterium]
MNTKNHTFINSSLFPLLFLLVTWAVFYYDQQYKLSLYRFGLTPMSLSGLSGILFTPILHADLRHILSNTFPMLILGTMLFYYYKEIAYKVFFIIYFGSSALVWLLSDLLRGEHTSYHIGASGVVYGLAGFLFFSGIIRKNRMLFGVSLLVTFLYGTVIWGIFPVEFQRAIHIIGKRDNVSWEGHLFGFLVGTSLAWLYKKQGIQKPEYSWDVNNDTDVDESNPYWLVDENGNPLKKNTGEEKDAEVYRNTSDNPFTVNYTYLPKKENDGGDPLGKNI